MTNSPYADIPSNAPLHVHLADLLRVGMEDAYVRTERHHDHSLVFTNVTPEPIKITSTPPDVILPDALKSWAPAIRLDVSAYLIDYPNLAR